MWPHFTVSPKYLDLLHWQTNLKQFHWTMATVRSNSTEQKKDMIIPLIGQNSWLFSCFWWILFLMKLVIFFTITNSLAISVATWQIKDFSSLCSNLWKQIVAPEQSVRITHVILLNSTYQIANNTAWICHCTEHGWTHSPVETWQKVKYPLCFWCRDHHNMPDFWYLSKVVLVFQGRKNVTMWHKPHCPAYYCHNDYIEPLNNYQS